MTLKRADLIIEDARELAHAQDYSETAGISQQYMLIQFNKAIHKLQKAIVASMAQPNAAYEVYTAPSAVYVDIPADCFGGTTIYGIEYSKDGSESNYYELESMVERGDGKIREPTSFEIVGRKIYFDSTVSSGYLRLRYERAFRDVDLRRAGVASYTPATVGEYLTALTAWVDAVHGTDTVYPDADSTEFARSPDYVCVVDRDGTFLCKDIRISAYDSASGAFTLVGSTGAVISLFDTTNRNAFITSGSNASTHPEGEPYFYDYFVEYLRWEIEKARSKIDSGTDSQDVLDILASIVGMYDDGPYHKTTIPIVR